jgi:hypothetical protein
MLARVNTVQVSKRDSDADHSVAAHSQVTRVIKKDHSCCACRIERLQQQGSYNHVRSPRLAEDRTTIQIVVLAKFVKPFGKGATRKFRSIRENTPRGLSGGVGVDDLDSGRELSSGHIGLLQSIRGSAEAAKVSCWIAERMAERFEAEAVRDDLCDAAES